MKKILLTISLAVITGVATLAQNNVGINTASPDASAALDVSSTTQGVLVPRMTESQRTLVASPATGLLVYQTDGTAGFYFYNGTAWTSLSGGGSGDNLGNHKATQNLDMNNKDITGAKDITATGNLTTKGLTVGVYRYLDTGNSILTSQNLTADIMKNTFIILSGFNYPPTLHGLAGGTHGKIVYLLNNTGGNMTIPEFSNVEPVPTNRILTGAAGGGNNAVTTGQGVVTLIYDATEENLNGTFGIWHLIGLQE